MIASIDKLMSKGELYVQFLHFSTYKSFFMDSKLTLRLNTQVIRRAKDYARSKKTSVSKLVENYLSAITSDSSQEFQVTPLVQELSGIISLESKDAKADYGDFLEEKYK